MSLLHYQSAAQALASATETIEILSARTKLSQPTYKPTKAELAATEKNPSKVVEHLKAAGKLTMDFAKEIGKDLVVDVIKKATGMP